MVSAPIEILTVSKSEYLLCYSMSSTCLHTLHTHISLRDDVAFLTGLVNARNKFLGKTCKGREHLKDADLNITTRTRQAMYSRYNVTLKRVPATFVAVEKQ
jgi:hypothetical protein